MTQMPTLAELMTPFPQSIALLATLAEAAAVMAEAGCQHLPVLDAQHQVVGLLSMRDIELARQLGHPAAELTDLVVNDVYRRAVVRVDLHTRLDYVLADMAQQHCEAALVMRQARLAGIVTHTDVTRFFAQWLHKHFAPNDEPDIA
ncbi:MAG: CBS domain-containing protein [Bacterioplanes sp.]|nr:CBS domain-containing protein [Bacterioplanes sp.]